MSDLIEVFSGMPDPEKVRAIERVALTLPQVDIGTQHLIHGKVSTRWGLIPKGCLLTGALTKIANTCIVWGDITVTTDEGTKRLQGFNVIPAEPGAKRAGIAHEDTWWATVHYTETLDQKACEDEMTDEAEMLLTRRDGIEYRTVLEIEACLESAEQR